VSTNPNYTEEIHDQVIERAYRWRIRRVANGCCTNDGPGHDRTGRSGQGDRRHADDGHPGGNADGSQVGRDHRPEEDFDQRNPGCQEVQEKGQEAGDRGNGICHKGAEFGRRSAKGRKYQVMQRCDTATAMTRHGSWPLHIAAKVNIIIKLCHFHIPSQQFGQARKRRIDPNQPLRNNT